MKNRHVTRALGVMLALSFALTLLASALYLLPTNDALMYHVMDWHTNEPMSGLPHRDLPRMVAMICSYLRGETDEFQLTYEVGGSTRLCFGPREQQHMADVQGLFALCRGVMMGGAAATVLLAALLIALRGREGLRGFRWGLLGVLALVTALALWALVDFESLFILFHEVAFTNDLWLLNPLESMLICLMPLDFFLHWAALAGGTWLAGLALALLLSALAPRMMIKGDENP